jgi:hypothetical protein
LHRDINRIFDGFWQQFDQPFRSVDRALGLAGPRAEVAETEDKVEVSMELQPIGGSEPEEAGAENLESCQRSGRRVVAVPCSAPSPRGLRS